MTQSKIDSVRKILYSALAIACLVWPFINSAYALGLGLLFGLALGNPWVEKTRANTHRLLSTAVIGLGAGMDLLVVGRVGVAGISYTAVGIILTLALGVFLGQRFGTNRQTSLLIAAGTAICGGSAIASVASVIRAKAADISVALAIVFLLNSVALFLFPPLGHYFQMTGPQFGLWAALAIHDTSSVVGASLAYGSDALAIGTTVKLARALWIVPVSLAAGAYVAKFWRDGESDGPQAKRKYPWFILGFLVAAAVYTWVPQLHEVCGWVSEGAKRLLVLTLFVIGSNLNKAALKSMGPRPLIQGVVLWFVAASVSLIAILQNWIHI